MQNAPVCGNNDPAPLSSFLSAPHWATLIIFPVYLFHSVQETVTACLTLLGQFPLFVEEEKVLTQLVWPWPSSPTSSRREVVSQGPQGPPRHP